MNKVILGVAFVLGLAACQQGQKIAYVDNSKHLDEYQEKKDADQVEKMVHGEEAKTGLEHILKLLDRKALTPEGKIKSYKIDGSYTMKGITEAVNVKLIINDDKDLTVKTALHKDSKRGAL